MPSLTTVKGYALMDVASALQKAIRRGDARVAGYFAIELFASGYDAYCWKRLMIISAEDCWGILTQEVLALHQAYTHLNTPRYKGQLRGRVFLAKAVLLLCDAKKSRDADHLTNFVYDREHLQASALEAAIVEARRAPEDLPIPDYAYDIHTARGKRLGKTKQDFIREEFDALAPRVPGLFDDVVDLP